MLWIHWHSLKAFLLSTTWAEISEQRFHRGKSLRCGCVNALVWGQKTVVQWEALLFLKQLYLEWMLGFWNNASCSLSQMIAYYLLSIMQSNVLQQACVITSFEGTMPTWWQSPAVATLFPSSNKGLSVSHLISLEQLCFMLHSLNNDKRTLSGEH